MDKKQLELIPSVLCLEEMLIDEKHELQKQGTNEIINFNNIPKNYYFVYIMLNKCYSAPEYDKLEGYKHCVSPCVSNLCFVNVLLENNYKLCDASDWSANSILFDYCDNSFNRVQRGIQSFINGSDKNINYIICCFRRTLYYIGKNYDLQKKFNIKEIPSNYLGKGFCVFKHRENLVKCATH